MTSKDQVHATYLEDQKVYHGGKSLPDERRALVLGVRPTNIGAGITMGLQDAGFVVYPRDLIDFDASNAKGHEYFYKEHGPVDTLVVCCGQTQMNWIEDFNDNDVEGILQDTLMAPIVSTTEFVKATIGEDYKKHIVYIGSMAYKNVLNASSVYCAAKAGLAHFARCMGWELTPKGYDVFCVNPSNTEGTPMTEETIRGIMEYRSLSRRAAEEYWGSVNLKDHWLTPHEIGRVVKWLVSGEADHLSGSMIDLAGGQR
jgi:NAD(P)-dependent dehydrogenase (short-subunit alcohol dehydrogenase family)